MHDSIDPGYQAGSYQDDAGYKLSFIQVVWDNDRDGIYPAVLAHAERQAVVAGRDEFGIEVPMINQVVVDYLLGHGYRIDAFMAVLMSNAPFGRFENYIASSPPFFI